MRHLKHKSRSLHILPPSPNMYFSQCSHLVKCYPLVRQQSLRAVPSEDIQSLDMLTISTRTTTMVQTTVISCLHCWNSLLFHRCTLFSIKTAKAILFKRSCHFSSHNPPMSSHLIWNKIHNPFPGPMCLAPGYFCDSPSPSATLASCPFLEHKSRVHIVLSFAQSPACPAPSCHPVSSWPSAVK